MYNNNIHSVANLFVYKIWLKKFFIGQKYVFLLGVFTISQWLILIKIQKYKVRQIFVW